MYQEQACTTTQVPYLILVSDRTYRPMNKKGEDPRRCTSQEHTPATGEIAHTDTFHERVLKEGESIRGGSPEEEELAEEEDRDPMGLSVIDNMEISMVHILPADFQSSTSQPSLLDDDVVTEEATEVNFVPTTDIEPTTNRR